MAKEVTPKEPKAESQKNDGPMILKQVAFETIHVPIIGITELIVHNWSEKAKRQIVESGNKDPNSKKKIREPRDPDGDYEGSKYKDVDGDDAFPTTGIKQAMVDSLRYFDNISMVLGKTAFFVEGEFIKIIGEPRKREDMVRVGKKPNKTADIRWRAGYPVWSSEITVTYATTLLTRESILSIIETAGMTQGIGEWRPSSPEKTGPFGRFKIDQSKPVQVVGEGSAA